MRKINHTILFIGAFLMLGGVTYACSSYVHHECKHHKHMCGKDVGSNTSSDTQGNSTSGSKTSDVSSTTPTPSPAPAPSTTVESQTTQTSQTNQESQTIPTFQGK